MKTKVEIGFSLCLFLTFVCQAATIYVDDDGPADSNSIQAAIDDSNDGDTIVVEKGVYLENIHFKGKNIVLTSKDPKDPSVVASTVIDGGHRDTVVRFAGTENPNCVLSGFTIRNGGSQEDDPSSEQGGGIYGGSETNHTHATIIGNTILQNGGSDGGGLSCCDGHIIGNAILQNSGWNGGGLSLCDGVIEKNIIAGNITFWWISGGGLYDCNGIIRNNVIVDNSSGGCESAGALSSCDGVIENCTIAYNRSEGYGPIANGYGPIRNCIIWANTPQWPLSNTSFTCTDVDPLFADTRCFDTEDVCHDFVLGDYHLKSQAGRYDPVTQTWVYDDVTSPCIDAGNPASPIMVEPFPNGGVINMGAYGGTDEASKSWFGGPVCVTIVAGDINGDCAVDLADFAILAGHWLETR